MLRRAKNPIRATMGAKQTRGAVIRPFHPSDDILALTDLLHRAYETQAARGLRFFASHQPPEKTAERISKGTCFIAEYDGGVVGTICLYGPAPDSQVSVYRDPHTYHFGQYAVDPPYRGKGIARALHDRILAHAASRGGKFMALDTAAPATDLLEMYARWGYVEVDRTAWSVTNYPSVIMRRPIEAGA